MKAAIYARYSSDKQSENSIEDQNRNCEQYAEKKGWEIINKFADYAITGTTRARPEYLRMLEEAEKDAFDVLIVDDLSRLSRDEIEMKIVIRKFEYAGIRIIAVSDSYDSADESGDIQASMRAFVNQLYIKDLRKKTHRGLVGKVLNGQSAGGRAYGYKRVPIENAARLDPNGRPVIDGVRWEINEEEAKWVRQIFEWYASGKSPKAIAMEFNRLKITSPRGSTWAANCIYGDAEKGTGLINNPLYNGQYVWNRTRSAKNPDTGKRKYFSRPKTEWIIKEMPELRIISEELWHKVKARQQETRQRSANLRAALNNPNSKAKPGKYIFSGLLKCGCCGANYTMYSIASYACATNVNRGDAACANKLRVPRRVVEDCLLECIHDDLYSKEAFSLFLKEVESVLRNKQTEAKPDTEVTKRSLEKVQKEIANLVEAVKDRGYDQVIGAALDKAQAEKAKLETSLVPQTGLLGNINSFLPQAKARYKALIDDLAYTLSRNVPQAREYLKTLVGSSIKLIPQAEGFLMAELQQSAEGLIKLIAGEKVIVDVVAGAGFEPTTFRL